MGLAITILRGVLAYLAMISALLALILMLDPPKGNQPATPFIILGGVILLWLVVELLAREKQQSEAASKKREEQAYLQGVFDRQRRRAEHLRDARERARIAFPEMLDEEVAKGFDENHPGLKELSGPDYDLIYGATQLVREEIEAIKAANPDWLYSSSVGKKLEPLNNDLAMLKTADEDRGYADLDLGAPARVIDCGEVGQVKLYTETQVEVARRDCGLTDYLAFLDRRARAPELARQIVDRAELAELKKREAEEARLASITTKLEDLPPVRNKDH